jgi:hypothetical protein
MESLEERRPASTGAVITIKFGKTDAAATVAVSVGTRIYVLGVGTDFQSWHRWSADGFDGHSFAWFTFAWSVAEIPA